MFLVASGGQEFPDGLDPDETGLVALGGDLTVATLASAYKKGIFPWTGVEPIPWYSPDPRMVLFPSAMRVNRKLRRLLHGGRFDVRFDENFGRTIRACATTPHSGEIGTWITPNMVSAFQRLFNLRIAHTVEVFSEGQLCGGLYGLTWGRTFFGESMFSRTANASKVALAALCHRLTAWGFHFIDCQEETEHLASLGAVSVSRQEYLARLRASLQYPSHHRHWGRLDTPSVPKLLR